MFLFLPLSASYYPVEVCRLVCSSFVVASPTYGFEGMRALLIEHTFRADLMMQSFV